MTRAGYYTTKATEDFWGARLTEGTLFVSTLVLGLFTWNMLAPASYIPAVTMSAAIFAGLVAVASLILRFWTPPHASTVYTGLYILSMGLISFLVITMGSDGLLFLSLWGFSAIFSAFFGRLALVSTSVLAAAQIVLSLQGDTEPVAATLVPMVCYSAVPIFVSIIIWRHGSQTDRDTSMTELAHKLSTTEGKSDVVINTIEDGVMAINGQGMIDLINPSAQTLIGWTQGDALGLDWRSVFKLVTAEGREVGELENPIAQALANNTPTHNDTFFLLTSSEKKRLVSIVSSPVGTTGSGVIVVFRDITKEKAEEREQAEFISTASHEMRTPVASIEGYLGLALNPATATIDEKARDFINKAHASAEHLGRLFQDLLDVSKAEDGRLKNEPRVLDVTETTGDIFEGLSHLAAAKQLHYIFKPNPSLETDSAERRLQPVFYADIDPSHFREVVANLIENAIKYTPEGDVVVDVKGDDKSVTISVADSGIGIPVEDIPHLFQKFYRVDNSDTREIGGTGLGLYLCRRLAEAMGGSVRVESEYKKGSTFFLTIPRISHEEAMRKLSEMPETAAHITLEERPALPTQEVGEQDVAAMDFMPTPSAVVPEQASAPQPAPSVAPAAVQQVAQTAPQPEYQPAVAIPQPYQQPQPTPYYTPINQDSFANMTLSDVEASVAPQTAQYAPPQQYTPPAPQNPLANQTPARVEPITVPPRPQQ